MADVISQRHKMSQLKQQSADHSPANTGSSAEASMGSPAGSGRQLFQAEVLEHLPMGVMVLQNNEKIVWVNTLSCDYLGIHREQFQALRPNSSNPSYLAALFDGSHILHVPQSGDRPGLYLRSLDVIMDDNHTLKYLSDISETVMLSQALEDVTLTDSLTGLPNMPSLVRLLDPMVSRSRRYETPLSIVIMQLNNIDDIANEFGKVAAENSITVLSRFLREQTRWADILGRVDSASFMFILQETEYQEAEKFVDKVTSQIPGIEPVDETVEISRINFCFGISGWQKGDDVSSLMGRARQECITALNSHL
ncbi:MAG: hypothetical protein BMS9Abin26_0416 [Gammaproteobacteria bacterium]|nr:MAG: hypothetical protein BMS9Abin26_0416 [Gammaproteobacteria bacterium]